METVSGLKKHIKEKMRLERIQISFRKDKGIELSEFLSTGTYRLYIGEAKESISIIQETGKNIALFDDEEKAIRLIETIMEYYVHYAKIKNKSIIYLKDAALVKNGQMESEIEFNTSNNKRMFPYVLKINKERLKQVEEISKICIETFKEQENLDETFQWIEQANTYSYKNNNGFSVVSLKDPLDLNYQIIWLGEEENVSIELTKSLKKINIQTKANHCIVRSEKDLEQGLKTMIKGYEKKNKLKSIINPNWQHLKSLLRELKLNKDEVVKKITKGLRESGHTMQEIEAEASRIKKDREKLYLGNYQFLRALREWENLHVVHFLSKYYIIGYAIRKNNAQGFIYQEISSREKLHEKIEELYVEFSQTRIKKEIRKIKNQL